MPPLSASGSPLLYLSQPGISPCKLAIFHPTMLHSPLPSNLLHTVFLFCFFFFFFTLVPCPSFLMSSPCIPPTHASANSFLCFCNCALWTWTPLCLRAALRSGFPPLHCWPGHSRHHLELLAFSFSKDMCSRTFTCELKEKKTVYQEFGYFFFPDPWA